MTPVRLSDDTTAPRQPLRALFDVAVARAHPRSCLAPHLPAPPSSGRIIVVGAGKANAAMALATEQHYAAAGLSDRVSGFVTTRHGFHLPSSHLGVIAAAHPVPDPNSALAAQWSLGLAASAGPEDLLLVLLSGGASALWSAPVDGVSLAAKQALTKQLLRSGATISEINTVRRHLSRIKGGRLAAAAARAGRVLTLAISDVPRDEPAAIGSGPTVPDPTTLADAREVLARFKLTPPQAIAAALESPAHETLKPGAAILAKSDYRIVAAPQASLDAVAAAVIAHGYKPQLLGDSLEGEARAVGRAHAHLALDARQRGERVAILSGGELTVTVVGTGAGGPNQEYALGLALGLDGAPGISALAGDSDGIDGGGGAVDDPAGALVLPDTLARAAARHMDAAAMLSNNNTTAFFRALGDLVECGPTQTNVNDIRIILVDP